MFNQKKIENVHGCHGGFTAWQALYEMLAGVLDPDSPVNIAGKFIILVTLGSREMLKKQPNSLVIIYQRISFFCFKRFVGIPVTL
mgnify:CR=1 FL=1